MLLRLEFVSYSDGQNGQTQNTFSSTLVNCHRGETEISRSLRTTKYSLGFTTVFKNLLRRSEKYIIIQRPFLSITLFCFASLFRKRTLWTPENFGYLNEYSLALDIFGRERRLCLCNSDSTAILFCSSFAPVRTEGMRLGWERMNRRTALLRFSTDRLNCSGDERDLGCVKQWARREQQQVSQYTTVVL